MRTETFDSLDRSENNLFSDDFEYHTFRNILETPAAVSL